MGTRYFLWFKEHFFCEWKTLDLCPLELLRVKLEGMYLKWSVYEKYIQKLVKKFDQVQIMLLMGICDSVILLKYNFSRVHITSVTLAHLNGAYKVEDGDGDVRDPYLKEHNVKTYFVINPKVSSTFILWPVTVIFEQEH